MMRLKLKEKLNTKKSQELPRPKTPAWYKTTDDDTSSYTLLLEERLQHLELPNSMQCRDVHCQCEEHSKERDDLAVSYTHLTLPTKRIV